MKDHIAGIRYRVEEEVSNLDLRYTVSRVLISVIPTLVGNRIRTSLLRLSGMAVGTGTTFGGVVHVHGSGRAAARVTIGTDCWINSSCTFDASTTITIGKRVALAQEVMILTNTHHLGGPDERAGNLRNLPVVIGDGVWIGARATILPGVTVGAGAVVASGALVNRSVEPNTLVAGVPAKVVRLLDPS